VENEDDRVAMLSNAFRAVATDDADLAASREVELRLLGEVRSIARARRRRVIAAALGAAAALTVVAAVSWRMRTSGPTTSSGAVSADLSRAEMATAFFPLTYSSLPISNAQLVRVQVPRSALASFGLAPIDVPDSTAAGTGSAMVSADVLVGEDGVARAVRFITP
jgi:hypothetical protein